MKSKTDRPAKRVGLLLLTRGGDGQTTAHLETRTNDPKQPFQKWPGLSLVTVGGKMTSDENEVTALLRLLTAQFGRVSRFSVLLLMEALIERDPEKQILFRDEHITLFGLVVPPEHSDSMNWGNGSAEFTQVTATDLSRLVKAKKKWKYEPHDAKGIVVFPETRVALLEAFRRL